MPRLTIQIDEIIKNHVIVIFHNRILKTEKTFVYYKMARKLRLKCIRIHDIRICKVDSLVRTSLDHSHDIPSLPLRLEEFSALKNLIILILFLVNDVFVVHQHHHDISKELMVPLADLFQF